MIQKNNNNNNNEKTTLEELRDLLQDRYSFGFDCEAEESFLRLVDELVADVDTAEYDANCENYDSFDEFVYEMGDIYDLFMWNSDAVAFICSNFDEDAADVLDETGINPFSDPNAFAAMLFEHMLYEYIDFEKLEAYARQQA